MSCKELVDRQGSDKFLQEHGVIPKETGIPGKLKLPPIKPACEFKNESREAARSWRKKKLVKQQHEKPLVGKHTIEIRKADEKSNIKKEPIPMRKRALPESFWHEPNDIKTSSLDGSFCFTLPPLFNDVNNHEDMINIDSIGQLGEKNLEQKSGRSCRFTSPPDTELLFSLFDPFEKKVDESRLVRRGRPRKLIAEKSSKKFGGKHDDDPCMVDSLSEKLFPQLSLGGEIPTNIAPKFAVLKLPTGERTVELPAIHAEKNYSAMLNELVSHM